MRIVFVSDTHGLHRHVAIPAGDVLVHCGDFTKNDSDKLIDFRAWLGEQPHAHKIVVAGNHERLFEDAPERAVARLGAGITYLRDTGITIDGVRFWGSPWQPWFYDWAFNVRRGAALAAKWALIPADTDVLITHGPPRGILDDVPGAGPQGCDDLWERVQVVRPHVHAFGHIHEGSGETTHDRIRFVNAAICDERYRPVNPARVIDMATPTRR